MVASNRTMTDNCETRKVKTKHRVDQGTNNTGVHLTDNRTEEAPTALLTRMDPPSSPNIHTAVVVVFNRVLILFV